MNKQLAAALCAALLLAATLFGAPTALAWDEWCDTCRAAPPQIERPAQSTDWWN